PPDSRHSTRLDYDHWPRASSLPATGGGVGRGSLFVDRGTDISPDRFNVLAIENAVPGRHVVLSGRDGINKSVVLVWSQASQIERPAATYIVQLFPVARRATLCIDLRSGFDPRAFDRQRRRESKRDTPDKVTKHSDESCAAFHHQLHTSLRISPDQQPTYLSPLSSGARCSHLSLRKNNGRQSELG